MQDRKISKRNYLILLVIIILVILYLSLNYFFLNPNTLSIESEYDYLSVAKNYLDASVLEKSFYDPGEVLYGDFPSYGDNPALYPFLLGLFLKIVSFLGTYFFLFNYLLVILIFIIFYFFSEDRLDNKSLFLFIFSLIFLPILIYFANSFTPEILLIFLTTLVYFLFVKNKDSFNILHFLLLVALALLACQRFSNIFVAIALLIFIYYRWAKRKKILYMLSSAIFFTGLFFLLYFVFIRNIRPFPIENNTSILQLINGNFSFLDTFALDTITPIANIKGYLQSLIDFNSRFFVFNWLILSLIGLNIGSIFKIRDKNIKNEILLVLIPEGIILLLSIVILPSSLFGDFSDLLLILGFIPLNIFYSYCYFNNIGSKIKIIIPVFLIAALLFSSYQIIRPHYFKKNDISTNKIEENAEVIGKTIEEQRFKNDLIIGTDNIIGMKNAIINNDHNDKVITIRQADLTIAEFKELTKKLSFDMWLVENDSKHIIEQLNHWPYSFEVKNENISYKLFLEEGAYPLTLYYDLQNYLFEEHWKLLNNSGIDIENEYIIINNNNNGPSFINEVELDLSGKLHYFLVIIFESPVNTYFQLFSKDSRDDSFKLDARRLAYEGENRFILEIYGDIIKIELGDDKGSYILKDLEIYYSDY